MLQAAAAALSKQLPALTRLAIEQIHDPQILEDADLEACMQIIVDRLCLSLQLSKPVGLATWATREGRRLGVGKTSVVLEAAAQAIAEQAVHLRVNHAHILAFLEVLKSDVHASLCSLEDGAPKPQPVLPESTQALLAMLGEADALTCCHSKATGEWARRLCASLRLSKQLTDFIVLCATLHDIGKVATPPEILQKTGPLTEREWDIMREHSGAGQRVLAQIPTLSRCATIVRGHHERFDGGGYPDGLAGESIPFEARVVAVADAFHAMISDRPYRRAIAPRRALEILRNGSGTQWDPVVVDAMLTMLGADRKPAAEVNIFTA
ncbi:MAG: HD-GYP domain-containing protein [Candidatus Baltobacteraceae bacterium]